MTELPDILARATPGPWSVDPDPREGMEWNRHIIDFDFNRVCFMAHSGGNSPSTDEANAALIALAPQLAAALIEARAALVIALDDLDEWVGCKNSLEKAGFNMDDTAERAEMCRATLTRIDAIMNPGGGALKGD